MLFFVIDSEHKSMNVATYAGSTMRSQYHCDSATDQSEKKALYAHDSSLHEYLFESIIYTELKSRSIDES